MQKDKPLSDWTYPEILHQCTWMIIEGIARGTRLKDCVNEVVNLVLAWQREVATKEVKATRKRKDKT